MGTQMRPPLLKGLERLLFFVTRIHSSLAWILNCNTVVKISEKPRCSFLDWFPKKLRFT